MVFLSDKFIYDGIHSDELGLILVDTTSNRGSLDKYGVEYKEELQVDHSFGNNPFYIHKKSVPEKIKLEFTLVDSAMNPIIWDKEIEEKILNFFMKDKFCEFISLDNPELVYYLYATKASKTKNSKKEGILEIEFQPYYQYPIQKFRKNLLVKGERETELENPSSVDEYVYPLIEVEALEDCDISIENKTLANAKIFKLNNLKKGQKIKVDNSLYIVIDDNDNNMFHLTNREWFKVVKGHNKIKLTGDARVKIYFNYEVRA